MKPLTREVEASFEDRNPLRKSHATVIPYGCKYVSDDWSVTEQPDGYVVAVEVDSADVNGCVRHELAHAADWHENGVTHEGEGTHAKWLNVLDAPK